ncbi:MAG: glycosyltransferase [Marinilabiliaceae bacterium]|nr:glycosyltransferase [Marinilabiliaceae bacterium]
MNQEIKSREDSSIVVSIRCTVYNHEPYLRQCLDGFVMQKTNFRFEAIVHDDASTDNSAAIIREYAEKYPDIIKPIYETENQYSKGDDSLIRIVEAACAGKYIAICEGDDYWTDPLKLQKQVDFLEAHEEYSLVADNALVVNTITGESYFFNNSEDRDYVISDMVQCRKFPTAGVLFRRISFEGFHETCRYSYDTMEWCYLAKKGKVHFCSNISSVYRRGMQGVTEYTPKLKWAKIVESWNMELIRVFGQYFDGEIVYESLFNEYKQAFLKSNTRGRIVSVWKMFKYRPAKTINFLFSGFSKLLK